MIKLTKSKPWGIEFKAKIGRVWKIWWTYQTKNDRNVVYEKITEGSCAGLGKRFDFRQTQKQRPAKRNKKRKTTAHEEE